VLPVPVAMPDGRAVPLVYVYGGADTNPLGPVGTGPVDSEGEAEVGPLGLDVVPPKGADVAPPKGPEVEPPAPVCDAVGVAIVAGFDDLPVDVVLPVEDLDELVDVP